MSISTDFTARIHAAAGRELVAAPDAQRGSRQGATPSQLWVRRERADFPERILYSVEGLPPMFTSRFLYFADAQN